MMRQREYHIRLFQYRVTVEYPGGRMDVQHIRARNLLDARRRAAREARGCDVIGLRRAR